MSSKHFQLLSHLSSPSLIHFYPFILNIYLLIQAHYFLRYNEYSTVALFDIYNLMISSICLHLWYHHYSEDMTCSYHLQMFPKLGSELRTLHMLAKFCTADTHPKLFTHSQFKAESHEVAQVGLKLDIFWHLRCCRQVAQYPGPCASFRVLVCLCGKRTQHRSVLF